MGDEHQFIDYCLIPLDPLCYIEMLVYALDMSWQGSIVNLSESSAISFSITILDITSVDSLSCSCSINKNVLFDLFPT